ncbi:MAG: urate hydroxylase PuuD, partial [Alphaproteobacteria bacterium]
FNWLDSRLTPPREPRKGIEGELWMVHSGGFYQVEKMQLAPEELPPVLHWFKWEAGFTWITGMLLLVIVYYLGSGAFLLDRSVADIGMGAAIAIGVGTIVIAWVAYDALWQSSLVRAGAVLAVISTALAVLAAYGLSQVLSGRAAYMHVGAMLGTLMAANVWVRIIPAQRQLVAATKAGTAPDARLAANAKERSLHNNYMTLPVVFIMVSSHFPSTYGHRWSWAVLAVLGLVGAGVRHFFNLRNKGRRNVWLIPAAAVAVLALMVLTAPRPAAPTAGDATGAVAEPVSFVAARDIIIRRCVTCHSANPTDPNFNVPPADIAFDTPDQIKALAARIHARSVASRTMPLGNNTDMTEEERGLLGRWIGAGAEIE